MKKVLIIGASSYIGSHLAIYLKKHYQVFGTYNSHYPNIDGCIFFHSNLKNNQDIQEVIKLTNPSAVIYCAGVTNNADCENNSELANYLNVSIPTSLANILAEKNIRFIYYSHSEVFSGEQGFYQEDAMLNPYNSLGSSKREAEEILTNFNNTFIFRMGKIFGMGTAHKHQFLNTLYSHMQSKKNYSLDSSKFYTYVSIFDVCKATGIVLDTPINMSDIYHLGSPTPYSEFDFAKEVVLHWGHHNNFLKPLSDKKEDKNFTLNCSHFSKTFQFQFTPIDVSLLVLKQNLQHGFY